MRRQLLPSLVQTLLPPSLLENMAMKCKVLILNLALVCSFPQPLGTLCVTSGLVPALWATSPQNLH